MKTRNGFVSNSSSSSFIVSFKQKPESPEQLKDVLFHKDQKSYPSPYNRGDSDDEHFKISDVLGIVWDDLQDQSPLTFDECIESLIGGSVDGIHRSDGYEIDENDNIVPSNSNGVSWTDFENKATKEIDWDAYAVAVRNEAKIFLQRFLDQNPDSVLFKFTYSDNDSAIGSAMEHGSLFKRLKHIRISLH